LRRVDSSVCPGAPERQVQQRVRRGRQAVSGGARPREGFGFRYQAGADRVQLGVAQGGPEVRRVQRAGIVAALPDVARGRVQGVKIGRVTSMDLLERRGERVGPLRDGDQVHVVRHEAVTEQGEAMQPASVPEELQVDEAGGVGFEDELARVAALGDVMRCVDRNRAGQAGHR